MDDELYQEFEGLRILDLYHEESLSSAIRYNPQDGDVILVTYPKSGSNWTQFILWNILTRGKQPDDVGEFGLLSPFLEVTGAGVAEHPAKIGPIATHLPYNVLKPVDHAKYVYVARNPYDCAVSLYHFVKGLTPTTYTDVSFEKFLSLFLTGKAFYGDYFDHVLPWYEHRHKSNILFITVLKPVDRAKYVYVARNPYDCAVSLYHFVKALTPTTYVDVSFEKFLSLFLSGKAFYGDYFDHVLPWYERRHNSNILFTTYEQLKADTKGMVLKITEFLGSKHCASMRNNDILLQRILYNCSTVSMRGILKDGVVDWLKEMAKVASEKPFKFPKLLDKTTTASVQMHEGGGFVHKGLVGDWKNYFTPEQMECTKTWIMAKTRGRDVMTLWDDLCLPVEPAVNNVSNL
ncbi:hypothetical protein HPB49_018287 [Dermacentor silvarum]|uniref:Uncharacterized protein n=1 Tax=Dermacentor silvarum TaxID=543639 RepID=A0ACB8CGG2_DERSI|nr:hypothetical protein HPB49_018287 [Dermacentor silvarum]